MCDKGVDTFLFVLDSVRHRYKTQEVCDKFVSNDPFMLKYCLDRYKTQEMCDKAVDYFLPALKFVPNLFFTRKVIKKLHNGLFTSDNILSFDENSDNVTFFSDEVGIISEDLSNINLDDVKFYEDDPETIIYVRLMDWRNRFKKRKVFKKRFKQRTNTYSITSYKMVRLVSARR